MEDVQFVSDLHLEEDRCNQYFRDNKLTAKCNYLVIAGDLCDNCKLKDSDWFVEWCSNNFKETFIVYGNHDWFGITNMEVMLNDWELFLRKNVRYVNNKSVIINDTELFFSTLWSELDSKERLVLNGMFEFKKIQYTNGNFLTFELHNEVHQKCRNWLKESIENSKAKYKIVVTHHCPTTSLSKKVDCWYSAFRSDDEDLMKDVDLWIYGHTHSNFPPKWFGRTLLVSNQFGHFKEKDHLGWDSSVSTKIVYDYESAKKQED